MSRDRDNIRVRFQGVDLVWLRNEDGSGALAPMRHVDADNNVAIEAIAKVSYAHVHPDGRIFRYGNVIGSIDDLERVQ